MGLKGGAPVVVCNFPASAGSGKATMLNRLNSGFGSITLTEFNGTVLQAGEREVLFTLGNSVQGDRMDVNGIPAHFK
jgi:hypothetical protein